MSDEHAAEVAEVIRAFDAAWARNDVEGVVALFAQDATLESPLVLSLLQRERGVLHGRDEIREMVRTLIERGTPWAEHGAPLIRGTTAAIEFKSKAKDVDARGSAREQNAEAFFSVDVIETKDGKIQSLRAYTGWRALPR
jgi:ketosteroid isomerase-like protein